MNGECDGCGGHGCPECSGDAPFRDPGGNSALRAGKLLHSCKGCGRKNMLSDADKARGYQCDSCADKAEGKGYGYGEY